MLYKIKEQKCFQNIAYTIFKFLMYNKRHVQFKNNKSRNFKEVKYYLRFSERTKTEKYKMS